MSIFRKLLGLGGDKGAVRIGGGGAGGAAYGPGAVPGKPGRGGSVFIDGVKVASADEEVLVRIHSSGELELLAKWTSRKGDDL